jgi:hypothetical protein
MSPGARKLSLTLHVVSSVGWLGAVIAYLVLVIPTLKVSDSPALTTAFTAMNAVGWYAIVPLCLSSLITGLIESLGTPWGLFRHYWVTIKLVLTAFSTFILLRHMGAVNRVAERAIAGGAIPADKAPFVVHPAVGLIVLVIATVLAIYKPWGLTVFGKRMREREGEGPISVASARRSKAVRVFAFAFLILATLFLILHSAGIHHGH